MGSDGGAWASDPATALKTGFVPQGIGADLIATIEGWTRDDVDAFAAESNHRAAKAWANGYFDKSVIPVKDLNGVTVLDHDELIRPDTTPEGLAGLKPSFAQHRRRTPASTTWRCEKYHWVEKINHVHHAGNSSGIVDGAALVADRQRAGRHRPRPHPAGPDHLRRRVRRRPDDHAHRPRPGRPQGAGQGRPRDQGHRPLRDQRGVRRGRDAVHARHGASPPRSPTSTAAPSPWATRSAPPAR